MTYIRVCAYEDGCWWSLVSPDKRIFSEDDEPSTPEEAFALVERLAGEHCMVVDKRILEDFRKPGRVTVSVIKDGEVIEKEMDKTAWLDWYYNAKH